MNKREKMTSITVNLGLALCVTLLAGVPGTAAASQIAVDTDFWNPHVMNRSDVKTANSGVNLKNDLGLDKKAVLDLTIKFKNKTTDPRTFFIHHDGANFQGNKTLGHSVGFQGGTYLAGDRVNSEMKYDHFQVGMKNESVTPGGVFSTIYQLNHVSLESHLTDKSSLFTGNKKETFNCLGIGFGWESLGTTKFFAEVTPLSIGGGIYSGYNLGVKSQLSSNTSFVIGYKQVGMQKGKDNAATRTRLDLSGMYWGLTSNF